MGSSLCDLQGPPATTTYHHLPPPTTSSDKYDILVTISCVLWAAHVSSSHFILTELESVAFFVAYVGTLSGSEVDSSVCGPLSPSSPITNSIHPSSFRKLSRCAWRSAVDGLGCNGSAPSTLFQIWLCVLELCTSGAYARLSQHSNNPSGIPCPLRTRFADAWRLKLFLQRLPWMWQLATTVRLPLRDV